jgi:16S rRNA (cytidine1402-2'-O)-methyltransferase
LTRGILYLVGTPIGNLGDITLRATAVLRSVSRIYAEDTRRTLALLSYLKIEGPRLLALHAHSNERTLETAIKILEDGDDIALVTDAGMPVISDPGADLVDRAHAAKIRVSVVPGPSAVSSAVALSGLVEGPFTFLGFLPRKGQKRRQVFEFLRELAHPVVFFEAPTRFQETLADLAQALGPRRIAICRELTKKHEEVLRTDLGEASAPAFREEWLGEITVVLEGAPPREPRTDAPDIDDQIQQLLAQGLSIKDVATQLSKDSRDKGKKSNRRELYARAELLRAEAQEREDALQTDAAAVDETGPESEDF